MTEPLRVETGCDDDGADVMVALALDRRGFEGVNTQAGHAIRGSLCPAIARTDLRLNGVRFLHPSDLPRRGGAGDGNRTRVSSLGIYRGPA